jgi:3-deoxy-manno-octulosonate cytidylyltransferase (CMP-KDO synthetase)
MMFSALAAIPVHLASKRLPRKALLEIDGRPLLWHVWRSVVDAGVFARVVIVTDEPELVELANSWRADVLHSKPDVNCGTERIASIADQLNAECIVNVQADMPCIAREVFLQLLSVWDSHRNGVVTPVFCIREPQRLMDPNLVKVVVDSQHRAIYFSRHAVPYLRDVPSNDWAESFTYLGHIGIYVYHADVLREFAKTPRSLLETAERLEQLRFLEAGIPVLVVRTEDVPMAIDSLEDVRRIGESSWSATSGPPVLP